MLLLLLIVALLMMGYYKRNEKRNLPIPFAFRSFSYMFLVAFLLVAT